jgi:hypothetical protein
MERTMLSVGNFAKVIYPINITSRKIILVRYIYILYRDKLLSGLYLGYVLKILRYLSKRQFGFLNLFVR